MTDWDGVPGSEEDLVRRELWPADALDNLLRDTGIELLPWQRTVLEGIRTQRPYAISNKVTKGRYMVADLATQLARDAGHEVYRRGLQIRFEVWDGDR